VLSDQLSDYEGEDGYTTAHVDIRSSRSARDFGRASGMLHTEEVTGSNPVSPTPHKMLLTRWKTSQERFLFGDVRCACDKPSASET
jgi:hypothetical protein